MTVLIRDGMDGLAALLGPSVAGEGSTDLSVLGERMARAALEHRPITLDVSALTLLPDEVRALASLVATAPGATVSLVCPRLTGRRLLRRVLPRSVVVVIEHPWADPSDEAASRAGLDLGPPAEQTSAQP